SLPDVRHAYAPARPFAKIVHWTIFIRLVALHLKGGAVGEISYADAYRFFASLRMTVRRCLFFCLDTKKPKDQNCLLRKLLRCSSYRSLFSLGYFGRFIICSS